MGWPRAAAARFRRRAMRDAHVGERSHAWTSAGVRMVLAWAAGRTAAAGDDMWGWVVHTARVGVWYIYMIRILQVHDPAI